MKQDTMKNESPDFGEEQIDALREKMRGRLSDFRLAHTLGVERMAIRLGEVYCPEKIPMLRVAALLHDLTKEFSKKEQWAILERKGIHLAPEEIEGPAAWHAITAAAILPEVFPEFATPEVISAVRWHTTGHAGMTLTEMLIYLADYIDDTRTFEECVALRERFWGASPERMSADERLTHLYRVMVYALDDLTIKPRTAEGKPIFHDAIEACDDFKARLGIL